MRRMLLILGGLGTIGLIAAALAGYGVLGGADPGMHAHALLSLAATLVLMFSHTWVVLYVVATGRVMADSLRARGGTGLAPRASGSAGGAGTAADAGAAPSAATGGVLERARRLRLHALPWLLAAVAALVATFLLGSVAFSGRILNSLHHAFFLVTLVLQVLAMRVEGQVLAEHDRLCIEVARQLEADAA